MIHFTNSKGERLPEDINKVANRYYDANFYPNHLNELSLFLGLGWHLITDNKWQIWCDVYTGNYETFYSVYGKQARKAEIIAEIEKLQNELKEL